MGGSKSNCAVLNELITIKEKSTVTDSIGGGALTYVNLATDPTPFAKVTSMSGKQSFSADRIEAIGVYAFKMLNRNDLDETMIIAWNSREYNIIDVQYEDTTAIYLVVLAAEGAAV